MGPQYPTAALKQPAFFRLLRDFLSACNTNSYPSPRMSNHSSSFQRQSPALPHVQANHATPGLVRNPSIVEMLSSPPPLPANPADHDDIYSLSLLRNTLILSRASSQTPQATDWADIQLFDLVESNKLIFIDSLYSVKRAFETLAHHNLTSVPVLDLSGQTTLCRTFDYSDLNTYLLLIMDKIPLQELIADASADRAYVEYVQQQIKRAKRGEEVDVDFIIKLNPKNSFVKFKDTDVLYHVMEALGNGVHRVAITDSHTDAIVGILLQRRLIKFMWENARRFPLLDFLLNSTLQDLGVGLLTPITIQEDQNLIEALYKMFKERVLSLAVVDKSKTLIGNILIVDVQNVLSLKNSHLLFRLVLNFILYNLTQKGIEKGQDQFPIFHVNKQTLLGRVIAKLVATQLHRLWIVQSPSVPSVSHSSISGGSVSSAAAATLAGDEPASPTAKQTSNAAIAAAAAAATGNAVGSVSDGRPGTLIGVVTLTDILGLFASAKANGKRIDPLLARNQRRRLLTSTTRSSSDATSRSETNPELFRKSYLGN